MLRYTKEEIYKDLVSEAMAIEPRALAARMASLEGADTIEADESILEALARPPANNRGAVITLPLSGIITQKQTLAQLFFGGTSTDAFGAVFDQAVNNPNIKAIVLDVDSPGGGVFGVQELSKKIFEARKHKHIIAVANSLMASAAFWIASAADEVVITPGGEVGSIGIVHMHADLSEQMEKAGIKTTIIKAGENKFEGNPFEPLSDDAREEIQSKVDDVFDSFVADVARNRSVTKTKVLKEFGQGRTFLAKEAVSLGLADRVATFDDVLLKLGVARPAGRGMRAEEEKDLRSESSGESDNSQADLERAIALAEL